jgi:hypothetical protein
VLRSTASDWLCVPSEQRPAVGCTTLSPLARAITKAKASQVSVDILIDIYGERERERERERSRDLFNTLNAYQMSISLKKISEI